MFGLLGLYLIILKLLSFSIFGKFCFCVIVRVLFNVKNVILGKKVFKVGNVLKVNLNFFFLKKEKGVIKIYKKIGIYKNVIRC